MNRRLSIIFAFMLIFQTFVSGISPAFVKAEGSEVNFSVDNVSVDENEATANWSVSNSDALTDGATATAQVNVNDDYTIDASNGDLTSEGATVGTYAVDESGNVSATFSATVEEIEADTLSGELLFNVTEVVEEEDEPEEANDEDADAEASEESEADEEESEKAEGEDSEEATEEDEEDADEETTSQSFAFTAASNGSGFSMSISDILDGPGGEAYTENNPLGPNDPFWLKIDWELENGHNYKKDDTVSFNLPKQVQINNDITDGELKTAAGELVATYEISTAGEITITFTDFVEKHSEVKGWIEVRAELDKDKVEEEDGKIVIDQIDEEGSLTIPIDRENAEKTLEKQGVPNQAYNGDEITWTVTLNKNGVSLKNVIFEDLLPADTEYVVGSMEIKKQKTTIGGNPVGDAESVTANPTVVGQNLSVDLGDLNEMYTITYKTKVTDEDKQDFKNAVTVTHDGEDLTTNATVTIKRGDPLNKGVVKDYDRETGIITWYLEFNYNQKHREDITISDEWTISEGDYTVSLVPGSVKFQEVEIDGSGKAINHSDAKDPTEFGFGAVTSDNNGMEIPGITTNKPYYITYQTKVDERVMDNFSINNIATFTHIETGEVSGKGDVKEYVGRKTAKDIDYKERTIDWEIKVNQDKHQMNDVEIVDTLGEGLTLLPGTLTVTVGSEDKSNDITLDPADGTSPFTIKGIGDTNEVITVTYTTEFDPDKLPKRKDDTETYAKNTADISWYTNDPNDRINKEVTTNKPLNDETHDSSWKSGTYNPDTKEITWTIISNYRQNIYDDFKIIDTPQGNQVLDEDSIEVYYVDVEANGAITDAGTVDESEYTKDVTDGTITIGLDQVDRAYGLTYKTKVSGIEDLDKTYKNDATIQDGDDVLSGLEASVDVYGDSKYGSKSGDQNGKQIHWSIDVNSAQELIRNLQLEDTITDNQEYLKETIKVYEAKVELDGDDFKTVKGDEVDASDYTLSVEDNSFTVKWNKDVESAFIVEYSTIFFAAEGEEVNNDYKITGDGIEESDDDSSGTGSVIVEQLTSGGAEGTAGYLVIEKLDTTYGEDNATPLKGIEFELIDADTDKVLKTATTDEDGYADFGRLLFGDYVLHEVNPPAGYETPDQNKEITINKSYNENEHEILDYVQTIKNYKDIEWLDIPVEKIWQGSVGDEVTIELLANGEKVNELTLSEANDWKDTFKGLDLEDEDGNKIEYTVDEVAVPGYSTKVTGDADEGFTITNTRTGETGVSVEKVWKGEPADKVTINLLANGDQEKSIDLSEDNDWSHTFSDLPKYDSEGKVIEYTVEEVDVDGYESSVAGDQEEGFTVTNLRVGEIEIPVEKVWKGTKKDSVTFTLFANGLEVDSVDVSAAEDWKHVFKDLAEFDVDGEPIEYSITEDPIKGYSTTIGGSVEEGFVVTNTRHSTPPPSPNLTDVSVNKVWEGGMEDSITVNLYANGEKVDEVELSQANNWQHTFKDLSTKINGQTVEYIVDEVDVDGYRTSIEGNDKDGFTITNTREGVTEVSGTKTWKDDSADDRPDSITVELYQNGVKIDEVEVTDADNWNYSFTDLAEFDSNGEAYEYTVGEVAVEDYETSVNGYNITNTFIPEEEDPEDPEDPDKEDPEDPDKEDPEDPEDPDKEDPEDPEDPDDPNFKDDEDENEKDNGNKGDDSDGDDDNGINIKDDSDNKGKGEGQVDGDGNTLPKTATNLYNYLLIGAILLIVGSVTFIVNRRREV